MRQRVTWAALAAAWLAAAVGCTSEQAAEPAAPGSPTSAETAAPAPGGPTTSGRPGEPGAAGAATLADVPSLVEQLEPSVVTILTEGGVGSGVVWSADGLVVTNAHVVAGATEVTVAFADGVRTLGTVAATDVVTDLAVVRAQRTGLSPAPFEPNAPRQGELVVAIGSPLGFANSVTTGVISGAGRAIPGSAAQGQSLVDLLQTDAAISPGNSGGALLNGAGRVVGIIEAYIPPAAGAVSLGFAIPSRTVVDVVEQLLATGRASHAYLGVVPRTVTAPLQRQLRLGVDAGAIVLDVGAGGPAAAAGVAPGDVIVAMDGSAIATAEELLTRLRSRSPGDVVTLEVVRKGERRSVRVTLTDRPR